MHGLLTAIASARRRRCRTNGCRKSCTNRSPTKTKASAFSNCSRASTKASNSNSKSDSYEPILGEVELDDGDTALSAHGWCEGFSRGVDLRARVWESRLGADSQLTELLGPIMALAVEEGVFATDADFAPLSEAGIRRVPRPAAGRRQRRRALLARVAADRRRTRSGRRGERRKATDHAGGAADAGCIESR